MTTQPKTLFQDMMDSERVVSPLSHKGKKVVCAVFWRGKNGLNYGGETVLSASLFDDTLQNKRIGFTPTTAK